MEAVIHQRSSFPTYQNSAIRQFCAARIEQEHGGEQWMPLDEEMDFIGEYPQPPPSELEEMVDTFFNLECYEKDTADRFQEQSFQENLPIYASDIPVTMNEVDHEPVVADDYGTFCSGGAIVNEVDKGLHLVHLLLACAEAVGCRDTQLADLILNQIWPRVNPWGDSLQRVSHCFAMGLKGRLSLLLNVNPNGSFNHGGIDVSLISKEEKSEAFALLHDATPYIEFCFMAANEAILQASVGKDSLHIVDLGMEHNLQWPSLVKSLASRAEGPPKIIRVTGIIGDQDPLKLENAMKGLVQEACFHGIRLEFHLVDDPVSPLTLTREKLDLREGEALFVNSIMHLHKHVKESRGSLKIILLSIKKLNPILLTVVEQDANHNGPFFVGRFLESLHYYSAIFDSIEASLPQNSTERMKIEKLHFAEEIRNVVAYEGSDRTERHERADQWRRQLTRAGFQAVGLKCLTQVGAMVSGYGREGYTVTSEKGCLLLGWKGRPIVLASAWQVNNVGSSSS